jgi:hypothetical protein
MHLTTRAWSEPVRLGAIPAATQYAIDAACAASEGNVRVVIASIRSPRWIEPPRIAERVVKCKKSDDDLSEVRVNSR